MGTGGGGDFEGHGSLRGLSGGRRRGERWDELMDQREEFSDRLNDRLDQLDNRLDKLEERIRGLEQRR
jgi:hypothetical protein